MLIAKLERTSLSNARYHKNPRTDIQPVVVKGVTLGSGCSANIEGLDESAYKDAFSDGTDGNKTATCYITVTDPVKVKSIKFAKKSYSVNKGKYLTLKATIAPKNATNKEVTWKTSDKKITKIDKNGKVKGLKKGTVTITATSKDGKKTAKCKVIVK